MNEVRTHRAMDPALSGRPVELAEGRARLELDTVEAMRADAEGLVHGGFVFSLADHAAMLAVNHPFVVLGSAGVKFLAPVRVGERLVAEAAVARADGKKRICEVVVRRGADVVFEGEFVCFQLPEHVLEAG